MPRTFGSEQSEPGSFARTLVEHLGLPLDEVLAGTVTATVDSRHPDVARVTWTQSREIPRSDLSAVVAAVRQVSGYGDDEQEVYH